MREGINLGEGTLGEGGIHLGEGHSEAEDEFIHEDEAVGGGGDNERDNPLGEGGA